MLTHYRRPVQFSLSSFDMAMWSNVDTVATIYKRDAQRFHLLLTEPKVTDQNLVLSEPAPVLNNQKSRLIWIEMSPNRVTMTMQGNGSYSYRHLWESGTYGMSRYWLQSEGLGQSHQLQMRNFALKLDLEGAPLPNLLHVDYELWSSDTNLGRFMLHLEIQH